MLRSRVGGNGTRVLATATGTPKWGADARSMEPRVMQTASHADRESTWNSARELRQRATDE